MERRRDGGGAEGGEGQNKRGEREANAKRAEEPIERAGRKRRPCVHAWARAMWRVNINDCVPVCERECMCVCVYVFVSLGLCVCVRGCLFVCLSVCVCACVHTFMCIYIGTTIKHPK